MNYEELKRKVDLYKNCSMDNLTEKDAINIEKINISRRKSSNQRILDFLNEVENPYVFMVKGKIVQIGFSDNGRSAEECLTNMLETLYK